MAGRNPIAVALFPWSAHEQQVFQHRAFHRDPAVSVVSAKARLLRWRSAGPSGTLFPNATLCELAMTHGSAGVPLRGTEVAQDWESLDAIDEGYCVVNVEFRQGKAVTCRFVEANPCFERQTGRFSLAGKSVDDELRLAKEERWLEMCGRVALTGQPMRFRFHPAYELHQDRCYSSYAFRVGTSGQNLVGILFRDGEDHRRSEAALTEAQTRLDLVLAELERADAALRHADERREKFIATLGHELRNPLVPISNIVELLKIDPGLSPAVEHLRAILDRQVRHMTRLVDDLLECSRLQAGKLTLLRNRTTLRTILHAAVETAQPHIQHQFSLNLPPEPLYLNADSVRLVQVFANLLNNAREFTPRQNHISLSAERQGDTVKVVVSDDGIGLLPADVSRIFQAFVQVDDVRGVLHGGLGLGLSQAESLVKMHGGMIHASSAGLGKGSEFVVILPLDGLSTPGFGSIDSAADPRRDERIIARLLIIDGKPNVCTAGMILALPSLRVHLVSVAEDGVRVANELRPDVILIDVDSTGLDGHRICASIRALPWARNVIILGLAESSQDVDRRESANAGFDSHLVKPVDGAMLLNTIASART